MRPRTVGVLCVVALTALASATYAGVSDDSPLAVYVTYECGEYVIGSTLNVTVHVFSAGVRHDPSSVQLLFGSGERDVPLERRSTGHFHATTSIKEDDLEPWWYFYLLAVATDDGPRIEEASARATIELAGGNPFRADVGTPGSGYEYVQPGDAVDVEVRFTFRGILVDPDEGSIEKYVDTRYETLPIGLVRASTGIYEGVFSVPSDHMDSRVYSLNVRAAYTPSNHTYMAGGGRDFIVEFYKVWLHIVSVTSAAAELDLYVLDHLGSPLEGVDLVVNHTYWDFGGDRREGQVTGATGPDGIEQLSITYGGIDPEYAYVDLEGFAEAYGYRQVFTGGFRALERTSAADPDRPFEVWTSDDVTQPAGTELDVHFTAYTYGNPLRMANLSVYARDMFELQYNGNVTTDTSGRFVVSITVPPVGPDGHNDLDFEFQTCMSGSWARDSVGFWIFESYELGEMSPILDPSTSIQAEPFTLGGTVHVTLDHPDSDGVDESARLFWGLGDITDWFKVPNLGWTTLSEMRFLTGFMDGLDCTWSDGTFHASFLLPDFLPQDVTVFLFGYIKSRDGDAHGAVVTGLRPLPPNPPPEVSIVTPTEGEECSGLLNVTGIALDDVLVTKVEARVDGKDWLAANGTTSWTLQLDTNTLAWGNHTVEVRAFDGDVHSPVVDVTFKVNQPPTVSIASPVDGLRTTTTLEVCGTASDDAQVVRVEHSLDGAPWVLSQGTSSWSVRVDVGPLASGAHELRVRSSDGTRGSNIAAVGFFVDHPPQVVIAAPQNGSSQRGAFELSGTSSDDFAVTFVEGRLDGDAWTKLTGTTAWSWVVSMKGLKEGEHTLEVRSWDGYSYSEVDSVSFNYKKPEESPGVTAALALLALAGAVGAAHLAARGRRP